MHRPFVVLAMLAGCLMADPAAGIAETDLGRVLVVGTEGAYPPWNLTRADGTLAGFEPALLPILCARAGLRCRLIAQDWAGMIGALQAGKIDMILDALEVTPARRAVLDYSVPYASTPERFVVQRDNPLAAVLERIGAAGDTLDLDHAGLALDRRLDALRRVFAGRSLGVQLSAATMPFLQRVLGGSARFKEYAGSSERNLDLLAGRIDATLEDQANMMPLLATPSGAALMLAGPRLVGAELGAGEAIGLRRGDRILAGKLNDAIAALVRDGTLARLSRVWLGMDAAP